MSKNQPGLRWAGGKVWIRELSSFTQTQNGRCLLLFCPCTDWAAGARFPFRLLRVTLGRRPKESPEGSGRGGIRTCDPALIKRML